MVLVEDIVEAVRLVIGRTTGVRGGMREGDENDGRVDERARADGGVEMPDLGGRKPAR